MNKLLYLSCISAWLMMVSSSEAPDNFLLRFDKDLHTFGVLKDRKWNKKQDKEAVEVKAKTMSNDNVISPTDDYEVAKQKIFDTIENAEKVVLTATKDLIHDEVQTFFGKHEHELPPLEKKVEKKTEVGRSRRGSDNKIKSTKKTSSKTKEEEVKPTKFARFLDEYIQTDFE